MRYDGQAAAEGHGFQAHVGPMRSKSRGEVRLKSPDPMRAPSIRFNYMSHPDDWAEFRAAIRLTREIFAQEAFKPFVRHEIQPGAEVHDRRRDRRFRPPPRRKRLSPLRHGEDGAKGDRQAVVDPEGRVIGVDALRVVDTSIFPRVTNGNLNAPSIMVGEKMADHILGRPALAPMNVEPWINPDWRQSQR